MEAVWSSELLVSYCITTQCHRPEDPGRPWLELSLPWKPQICLEPTWSISLGCCFLILYFRPLPFWRNGGGFLELLQECVIPDLQLHTYKDGAPAHYSYSIHSFLNETFLVKWLIPLSDRPDLWIWHQLIFSCGVQSRMKSMKRSLQTQINSGSTMKRISTILMKIQSFEKLQTVSKREFNCVQALEAYILTKL